MWGYLLERCDKIYYLRSQIYDVVNLFFKNFDHLSYSKTIVSYHLFCCDLFYYLRLFERELKSYIFEQICK
jgi:hypothetical protein